jgi:glycosyltransferase involved in cell wall biosynthesis
MSTAAAPVSVIMTVRDGERYIAEALRSLLEQSEPPAEVVVVDDGSIDSTSDVVASFGAAITLLHQPRTGIAAGINRGLAAASHDVLGFLDADDLWAPEALGVRLAALRAEPASDGVRGAIVQFLSEDVAADISRRFDPGPSHAALLGAMLLRRDVFDRIGRLDESVTLAPAIDWIARARLYGIRLVDIDGVVLHRRIHAANVSLVLSDEQPTGLFDVVRRQWERRRAEGPS